MALIELEHFDMTISPKIFVAVLLLLVSVGFSYLLRDETEIINADSIGSSIVSFGDSLTYGTGAAKGMDYPSQLSSLIEERVINLGKPGDTTETAQSRLGEVFKHNPRIVLITLGGNDLKNGVDKQVAFQNLKNIITEIQSQGALVVLGGLDIPLFGRGFADEYRVIAHETGSVLIPNIFDGIMGDPKLMSDRIHPNSEGYSVMTQHFHLALKPYL